MSPTDVVFLELFLSFFVIPWWIIVFGAVIRRQGERLVLFYLEEKKKFVMKMGEESMAAVGKSSFHN